MLLLLLLLLLLFVTVVAVVAAVVAVVAVSDATLMCVCTPFENELARIGDSIPQRSPENAAKKAKNVLHHHTCCARHVSNVQISKCKHGVTGLQIEASAEHTSPFCKGMETRHLRDPSPPRHRKCLQFV